MATNGLARRIERLEAAGGRYAPSAGARDAFLARILARAGRLAGSPAPPIEKQSRADRAIRAALAEAEGADTVPEYAARFWRAFLRHVRLERGS